MSAEMRGKVLPEDKFFRCGCGAQAVHQVVPETRWCVELNKCSVCFELMLRDIADRYGVCEKCRHPVLHHFNGCQIPHCTCNAMGVMPK